MPGELRLRAPNGTLIDLHWHVLNHGALRTEFDVPTMRLLHQARPMAEDTLRVLAPADQLAHTALHASLTGGNRLVWLVDVDRIARSTDLDWECVIRTAIASRTGLVIALALSRAKAILHTPVAKSMLRRIAGGRAWLAAGRAIDSRGLLALDASRPAVAVAFARSTRSNTARSQVEFAKHGLGWLRSGAPRTRLAGPWLDPGDQSSALYPVADDAARAAYFSDVSAQ
jgi:hypothetical protein